MNRLATVAGLLSVALVGIGTPAWAQSSYTTHFSEMPKAEVALITGLWTFDQSGQSGLGGRLTINRSEWMATQVSFDFRKRNEYFGKEGLLIVNARAQLFDPASGIIGYVTAGGALGIGLQRFLSPMIGAGIGRWTDGIIAWHAEIQHFIGGPMHDWTNERLMGSIVIGFH